MAYKQEPGARVGTKYNFEEVKKAGLTGPVETAAPTAKEKRTLRKEERKAARAGKKYGAADLEAMIPEERAQYEKGMSEGLSEKKMVKEGLIDAPSEHHKYKYNIRGQIKREEGGFYKEVPKTLKITGVPPEEGIDPSIDLTTTKTKKVKHKKIRDKSRGRYNAQKSHKRKGKKTKNYVKDSSKKRRTTFRIRGKG
jgi:hypothetical protein